jgi:hypothetical protein
MATLSVQISKLVCNLPGGRFIGPLIIPVINPIQLLLVYLPVLLVMHYGYESNSYNSENGEKNMWKTSKWAFLFYWLCSAILLLPLLLIGCSYMDDIPNIPGITTFF